MRAANLIHAIDLHASGEPGRVIVGGVLDVPGRTMFETMEHLRDHHDDLRHRMLREPRGYPAAYCNLLLPPTNPDADAGFVIMEQVDYPPMSGTNIICVVTALLETEIIPANSPTTEIALETPAGLVRTIADVKNGTIVRVTFENVPSFVVYVDAEIDVPRIGSVTVDVAYGGIFTSSPARSSSGSTLFLSKARRSHGSGRWLKLSS